MLHYIVAWSVWARGSPVRKHFERSLDTPGNNVAQASSLCSFAPSSGVFQVSTVPLRGTALLTPFRLTITESVAHNLEDSLFMLGHLHESG
jgi:hypothetical protein